MKRLAINEEVLKRESPSTPLPVSAIPGAATCFELREYSFVSV